ncbi:MAG: hypothetical protein HY815_23280, partial [Candidatus Riflebacteria bacterium]|nr:hypothetical protein [Candidatus Riflebacteria bacterium]
MLDAQLQKPATRTGAAVRSLLEDAIGVKPGEYTRSALFFLYLVVASAIYITGKTVRDTLFLSRYDISALPLMFIGYGLVSPIIGVLHGRVADRFGRGRLIVATSILSGLSYVGVWLVVRARHSWIYPTFYIWAEVIGSLFLTQFWTLANDYHTSRDAKRLFGIIGAGRVLGIVGCGWAISRTARAIGTENLILIVVAMMLLVIGLVGIIRLVLRPVNVEGPQEAQPLRPHPSAQTETSTMSSAYARLVAAIICVTFLVCTLADYQFKIIAKQVYTGDEMAAFFGTLYAVIGGFAFVLQFFFTGRILARFGLLVGLLIMPLCMLGSSAALVVAPVILVASALKFSDNAFQYSINEASCQLLYFPFPQAVKGKVRALMDGLVKPAAYALAGLVLLAAVPFVSTRALCLFTIPLVLGWIVLAWVVKGQYVLALSRTLRDRRLRHGHQSDEDSDLLARQSLIALVGEQDEETALFALEQLRRTAPTLLASQLGSLLANPRFRVRLAALAMVEESPSPALRPAIETALNDSPGGPLRAAAILAHCSLLGEEALDRVVPLMDSDDPEVAEAVMVGALKYCGLEGVLACGSRLHSLLHSSAEGDRVRAARILGRIGVRHFYRQLEPLFRDGSTRVRVAAARAAGLIV